MQRTKINSANPEDSLIEQAADKLKSGGVVVCPTDTVYIFAADATNVVAIGKVYEIKGREYTKPIHVIVRDWEMVKELCEVNETALKLFNEFLPVPLTIVLPKNKSVPDLLTANLPTLGIRIPNNEITRAISAAVDFPFTATSANKSGGPDTYSVSDVLSQLEEKDLELVDFVLDAGELPKVDPSTIVDCTTDIPKILRPGPITQGQIESALGIKIQ